MSYRYIGLFTLHSIIAVGRLLYTQIPCTEISHRLEVPAGADTVADSYFALHFVALGCLIYAVDNLVISHRHRKHRRQSVALLKCQWVRLTVIVIEVDNIQHRRGTVGVSGHNAVHKIAHQPDTGSGVLPGQYHAVFLGQARCIVGLTSARYTACR